MPSLVFKAAKKSCKNKTKIGLLATEATIKTKIYNKYFDKDFDLLIPPKPANK